MSGSRSGGRTSGVVRGSIRLGLDGGTLATGRFPRFLMIPLVAIDPELGARGSDDRQDHCDNTSGTGFAAYPDLAAG